MAESSPNDTSLIARRLANDRWARTVRRLRWSELVSLVVGVTAVLIHTGFVGFSADRIREINWVVVAAISWLGISRLIRFSLSVTRRTVLPKFFEADLFVPTIWVIGVVVLEKGNLQQVERWHLDLIWTQVAMAATAVLSILSGCRQLAARTKNSAVLLVGSFLVVITVGMLLLKLPVCLNQPHGAGQSADWNVALFTATSASCVTGLIVEPTGSYWSPAGHAVIFGLFQIGGLGILTFGAFIAVLSGRRGLQFREARTLRDMLDADSVQSSRRLLLTILLSTLLIEAVGAVSLMGLWPQLPFLQRLWHATFHSVSAFCNAGFSLSDDGFLNMGTRWQVWGPLTWLIIFGGLGFPVANDLWRWTCHRLRWRKQNDLFGKSGSLVRLSLSSRLVLWSSAGLLLAGALGWFVLESIEAPADASVPQRVADSWFQSVTFRTAGFNTVDHGTMNPATKLLGIFLMFIGAAPGSTGGGVKTIVFVITVLSIWAVFRGRSRVEIFGRCIPEAQVARAFSMLAIGVFIVLATTMLLVIFERQPGRFIDHFYEATSAFATAGVSANITPDLTLPSRLLICVVMFLGRVGPITLLLAMASPGESSRYDYPEERVSLG